MDRIKIDLKNCYGIKSLQWDFDFSQTRAYALYAANGVMKSSLAKTFQDASLGIESSDRIFPTRNTLRKITDEAGKDVEKQRILVVLPYSSEVGISERTSTLLVDAKLKTEYEFLLHETEGAKEALLTAIREQSRSKKDLESEISAAFTSSKDEFENALTRIKKELEDHKEIIFAEVEYDKIFDDKVIQALNTKDLKGAIEDYARRYNDLLSASTYFKKGTFDYYNANQIAKSLADNGFFDAKHTVSLNAAVGNREITTQKELEEVVASEKDSILTDKALRKKFDDVAKQLQRNAELREFYRYIQDNEAILSRLNNPDKLKEDILKSYLKVKQNFYTDWMAKHEAAAQRRKEIEEEARRQRTQWEKVIAIFNDRFFVPFKLEAKNRTQVMLGEDAIIDLGFTYVDGVESAEVEKTKLLEVLSAGEKKALYVLNVIFEIETRILNQTETLIVVDDLADSFDYQNKYAIIQYLKEISDDGLFKLLIMTHNFDFFRTLESRFVNYSNCFIATKNENGITLAKASGIRNVFANDWKDNFFRDPKKKIASIAFLRNLVEMTTGVNDPHYEQLSAMLHWKSGSDSLTVGKLDQIFNAICKTNGMSNESPTLVCDLVDQQAKACMGGNDGMNLENKIVLAIAIRICAERFIIRRIADPEFVAKISENQTQALISKFKQLFPTEVESIAALDQVALMTPENIHLNSFMYEPIVDMSDDHLRKLYGRVQTLP